MLALLAHWQIINNGVPHPPIDHQDNPIGGDIGFPALDNPMENENSNNDNN